MGSTIRLPVALVFGIAFTALLFWGLWSAVTGEHKFGQLRSTVKVDFSPLRHDTDEG